MKHFVNWNEVNERICQLRSVIGERKVWGVPRGGAIVAGLLGNAVDTIDEADCIVDDIIDSGETQARYDKPFYALIDKRTEYQGLWLEFPWEENELPAEDNVRRILQAVNENPTREGLIETPARYMKFLTEFLSPPEFKLTTFAAEKTDEMIVQSGISFFSLCEHHLAPFFGEATVAYIPNGKIVGLSKLARTVEKFSRKLQNQERITTEIADHLEEQLKPRGIAVMLRARHLCMEMRGVRKQGAETTTSCLRGLFKEDGRSRAEFLQLSSRVSR
jgi:GTP cyclohydrolase IA